MKKKKEKIGCEDWFKIICVICIGGILCGSAWFVTNTTDIRCFSLNAVFFIGACILLQPYVSAVINLKEVK